MKVFVQFLLLSVLVGFYTVTAFADDLTPAAEDVCDYLQGPEFTPGLFGLCNAYCEARDCDEYGLVEDQPKSCQMLWENFVNNAIGPDDPLEPPCLDEDEPEPDPVLCPCWPGDDDGDGTPNVMEDANLPLGEGTATSCLLEPPDFFSAGVADSSFMVTFILLGNVCDFFYASDPPVTVNNLDGTQFMACRDDILDLCGVNLE